MPSFFANKVAIVTGASSGIGWELARALAAEGSKVGMIARRQNRLAELTNQIQQRGGAAAYAIADVANRANVLDAVSQIQSRLGPVDILIANAGIGIPTLLSPINVDDVERMFQVNVMGTIYAVEAVLPGMLERQSGNLAALSSLAANKGLPGESGYCASKAAVSIYMEGLRIHLRKRGIRVTTICPGFIKTPMTAVNEFPMPFLMDADEAARRILRAIRWRRKVYNFPWQTSLLMKVTSWLPDWVIAKTMSNYNKKPPMPVAH
jgi:short-subunit dehydrogenase